MGASNASSTADPSTPATEASETHETSAPVPRNEQKKRCAEKKALLMQFAGQNESNAAKVCKFTHSSPGHPPLEDMHSDIHQAIVELATVGAGADRRHYTDVLNACKTLDDLCAGLLKEGYILSWQALYVCLIPGRIDNTEAK